MFSLPSPKIKATKTWICYQSTLKGKELSKTQLHDRWPVGKKMGWYRQESRVGYATLIHMSVANHQRYKEETLTLVVLIKKLGLKLLRSYLKLSFKTGQIHADCLISWVKSLHSTDSWNISKCKFVQDKIMSGINVLIEQYRALILCCWSIYFTEDKEPDFPKTFQDFLLNTTSWQMFQSWSCKALQDVLNIKGAIPHIRVLQPPLTQQGNCYPEALYKNPEQKTTL